MAQFVAAFLLTCPGGLYLPGWATNAIENLPEEVHIWVELEAQGRKVFFPHEELGPMQDKYLHTHEVSYGSRVGFINVMRHRLRGKVCPSDPRKAPTVAR